MAYMDSGNLNSRLYSLPIDKFPQPNCFYIVFIIAVFFVFLFVCVYVYVKARARVRCFISY